MRDITKKLRRREQEFGRMVNHEELDVGKMVSEISFEIQMYTQYSITHSLIIKIGIPQD